ncbi:hypothetical protein SAMN05660909_03613 [Chitinophaga terrae (ex Kim and Jung 2007)]|uniref:Uncharacterized protein n=2 Tax=Chitinophaga terrae (ex Kim and Jung 2007) TaxID=408074 RepID=A0A1H4ECG0_9BACT|nr:hypothetical protein CTE07_31720 [Chitinophaga terrae (ex Kim and Jung 2007)]SEA82270.1 hypothetical protein SAMN05660909_03613 [Chitinophaga terrae (ex Kim and Jung 2007)]
MNDQSLLFMRKVKIDSYEALDLEVARLKKRSRQLEKEIGGRVDYFKNNYKKMAVNAVIPSSARQSGALNVAMNVAKFAWQSGKVKNFATGALMTALEFIGVQLGINLFNKVTKRRRKKKEPEAE